MINPTHRLINLMLVRKTTSDAGVMSPKEHSSTVSHGCFVNVVPFML